MEEELSSFAKTMMNFEINPLDERRLAKHVLSGLNSFRSSGWLGRRGLIREARLIEKWLITK